MNNLLYEILAGKSKLLSESGGEFFYKHPTVFEGEFESKFYNEYYTQGVKMGLKTEEFLLEEAKKYDCWSTAEEEETKQLRFLLPRQQAALAKHTEPNIRRSIEDRIKETETRLEEIGNKRDGIVRYSLENFISKKVNVKLFKYFIYDNENCSGEISDDQLYEIAKSFFEHYNLLNSKNEILKACYGSFFELFSVMKSNPYGIFGKNIYELTIFQKNLLVYSSLLRFKLDNYPKIPDRVINDPIALFNYSPSDKNEAESYDIRQEIKRKGGLENMTALDKAT